MSKTHYRSDAFTIHVFSHINIKQIIIGIANKQIDSTRKIELSEYNLRYEYSIYRNTINVFQLVCHFGLCSAI